MAARVLRELYVMSADADDHHSHTTPTSATSADSDPPSKTRTHIFYGVEDMQKRKPAMMQHAV